MQTLSLQAIHCLTLIDKAQGKLLVHRGTLCNYVGNVKNSWAVILLTKEQTRDLTNFETKSKTNILIKRYNALIKIEAGVKQKMIALL